MIIILAAISNKHPPLPLVRIWGEALVFYYEPKTVVKIKHVSYFSIMPEIEHFNPNPHGGRGGGSTPPSTHC